MNDFLRNTVAQSTGSSAILDHQVIQRLWSGYGAIMRITLKGASMKSVIVKHVQFPKQQAHPRGWNTDLGHQRKVHSYRVETHWYQTYSTHCNARLPKCLAIETRNDEVIMVLEDLNEAGFHLRKNQVNWKEISACLQWLATFHASYLGQVPHGLWSTGTYWHLETRPHELDVLDDERLKAAAPLIDEKLRSCEFQTFVHGDAKLANFCFSPDGQVAGVDFQYVGGGCGMKDVAYFIGSCLSEKECERLESKILETYFHFLSQALPEKIIGLEEEWRSLYRVAWADFHRFLKGWSPDHWKIHSYSERVTKQVIEGLSQNSHKSTC